MSKRTVQLGGLAAIIFVVLILITVFGASKPPAADDSIDKIRTYLSDNRSALLLTNMLGLVATPFVGWFVVVLRKLFSGDPTAKLLGTGSLVGIAFAAPMAMAGGVMQVTPIYLDGFLKNLGDDSVRILFEAQTLMFSATSAGIVLFSLTAGLAIMRSGALPSFTAWLGFLATIGNVVTMFAVLTASSASLGFLGVLTFALFVLVTGITMALGKATPRASAA